MKKLLLLIFVSIFSTTYSQESVNTSGGNATGTGGSVSYSVGQVAYLSHSGSGGSFNEGVQQPFEIFLLSTTNFEDANAISIHPNPTSRQLFLTVKEVSGDLNYSITNVSGKILMKDKVSHLQTTLNVENLASGIYIFTISSEDNSKQKVYKIIKN
ncbi:MAG: T9SS type A sorting domain-containing protein [Bacteroidota bacterium]